MRKGLIEKQIPYKSMPYNKRFWVSSESCYTEDELIFRSWVIKTRANSGIHPDYLINPSSWFTEDSQALVNINDKSWIFPNAYKPRQVLSHDEFHVQPIDNQRLQWSALYDLMQKTGDYLLLRNKDLPAEHLNHPMNFVLLDINNMLKGLSQNADINQVKTQLELITKYVRTLEKNISPIVGSDRLFLADFRAIIDDDIEPFLSHKIESQLLRERLGELFKALSKLSTDRNRILHFALNINPVNPHPYDFSIDRQHDLKIYPTQAAKDCGQSASQLVIATPSLLKITAEQLNDCPHFKLISMNDEVLGHYAAAITDLNELDRFQKVVTQIIELLGQAGEVYTIYQFKEQMLSLLKEMDGFINHSSAHIEALIHANTIAYHQAIQDQQGMSWLQWLTVERDKLKTYIKNQDTLAQFPSTAADLEKTNKHLKEHVGRVISHLSQPRDRETSFAAISGQAQELNQLMESMHAWISIQHEIKGIAAPQMPEVLPLLPSNPSAPAKRKLAPPSLHLYPTINSSQFFPTTDRRQVKYVNQSRLIEFNPTQNNNMTLNLLAVIPLAIIALCLLMKKWGRTRGDEQRTQDVTSVIEPTNLDTTSRTQ